MLKLFINDLVAKSDINIDASNIGRTRLEIDLDCLAWNIRQIRNATSPKAHVCAAVKANAYGHGAVQIADTLLANGADSLCVATPDEATELRNAGVTAPILILGSLEPGRERDIVSGNIAQTVSSYSEMKTLSKASASLGRSALIHIKIDTGMNRLGFVSDDATAIDEIIAASKLPWLKIEGIFTHFASSDEPDPAYTITQLKKFNDFYDALLKRGLAIPIHHCANSSAISGFTEAHMEMVRPGIAIYGGGCGPVGEHHKDLRLKRAMTLRTKIALIKNVAPDASVGYNRRFTAQKPTVIAVLPVGYADGYNRALSRGRGYVLIHGVRAPIAGTICMDQCMADVTDIEGASVGDDAVLIGKQGADEITFEELTETLNTAPHEIMCSIGRRVPRVFIQNGMPAFFVKYL